MGLEPRGKPKRKMGGPVVALRFFWEGAPIQLFKEFIEKNKSEGRSGAKGVSKKDGADDSMPVEFKEYMSDLFENELNYPVKEWRYWIGVTLPQQTNEHLPQFAKGFPHAHGWDGITAAVVVQVGESGGELVLVEKESKKVFERFEEKVGRISVIDGWSTHGVETVGGEVPRYTLIATEFGPDAPDFQN